MTIYQNFTRTSAQDLQLPAATRRNCTAVDRNSRLCSAFRHLSVMRGKSSLSTGRDILREIEDVRRGGGISRSVQLEGRPLQSALTRHLSQPWSLSTRAFRRGGTCRPALRKFRVALVIRHLSVVLPGTRAFLFTTGNGERTGSLARGEYESLMREDW